MTLLPPPLFFPLRRIERYRRAKHYGKEGRETTMFLHALPYHVENFSFLSGSEHPDYIQSRRFPVFFFSPPIPGIFSSGMRGKNIFLARISLHARPIKKQDAYFLGRTVHFPDVLDVDPTLRKSVNHPRGKLARASGDRRG